MLTLTNTNHCILSGSRHINAKKWICTPQKSEIHFSTLMCPPLTRSSDEHLLREAFINRSRSWRVYFELRTSVRCDPDQLHYSSGFNQIFICSVSLTQSWVCKIQNTTIFRLGHPFDTIDWLYALFRRSGSFTVRSHKYGFDLIKI